MFAAASVGALAPAAAPPVVDVRVAIEPTAATVGDVVRVVIEVDGPAGVELAPTAVGPELGPFAVVDGSWSGPTGLADGASRWTWSGAVSAYEVGTLQLPAIPLSVRAADGTAIPATTEAQDVRIVSVLDAAAGETTDETIADLKPPASLRPDYRAVWIALGVVAALLAVSAALWWLHRRYADRLAAVAAPEDPFHRTPAHVWVYAELQKLLDRRLAEQGQVALFFEELARILKRYLGGRYRIDLMEATTYEVPDRLGQAGAAEEAIDRTREVLDRCDLVKFARVVADPDACRSAVEQAYRVVDITKPADAGERREKGAA